MFFNIVRLKELHWGLGYYYYTNEKYISNISKYYLTLHFNNSYSLQLKTNIKVHEILTALPQKSIQ